MYTISNYFDLSDLKTLKSLRNLSEDAKKNITSKALENEFVKVNNKLSDKNVTKRVIYLNTLSPTKVKEFWDLQLNSLRKLKDITHRSDLNKEDKNRVMEWINDNEQTITIAATYSGAAVGLGIATGCIYSFIGAIIGTAIGIFIIRHYNPSTKKIEGDVKKTLNNDLFKTPKAINKIGKDKIREINNLDNSNRVKLIESQSNNILNEVFYLEFRLLNSLLDFVVNVLRAPVYLFYRLRVSIDDYLKVQIMLLEDNISNNVTDKKVKAKQEAWLNAFKKLSQKIEVDFNKADIQKNKDLKTSKPKYDEVISNDNKFNF